ncbi:hypothetical protein G5714_002817 [Onychostoma macrolepis]|uniref:Uncharacterized protein n=1 Tax=Onychostoma macrolepis TaxID=369639 RepID=A0A7J6D7Q7_9TELE|nr:hypothetical protein G5714_002817 [Onychostoma macrolepis]
MTHHENTLFEKSKELALKLKDKANDEETLKKEFDLFWKMNMKIISDTPAIRDIDIMNMKEILSDKKKDEYYSIFQKYCNGATSAAIFGEIICQKLKGPIEQSVYKNTARELTDEMRSNCESLNGSRSNLEKHILKKLAEEEDFDKYMNYIKTPRDHFKSFIRDEVSRYITDQFSVNVLPKMKENIRLLQQKIIEAAHESTEHVQVKRGDAGLWLKSFTQQLSDELIFSEKDLSGVKHDDVDDFNLLEDVIRQELPAIMSDISSRFNTETFPVKLDFKFRPDELLIDHLCQCCWVQCPFCKAICTNTIENHDGDHSVAIHHPSSTPTRRGEWSFDAEENLPEEPRPLTPTSTPARHQEPLEQRTLRRGATEVLVELETGNEPEQKMVVEDGARMGAVNPNAERLERVLNQKEDPIGIDDNVTPQKHTEKKNNTDDSPLISKLSLTRLTASPFLFSEDSEESLAQHSHCF